MAYFCSAAYNKHRSEAVTLQFVGRFTRARSDLGTATVIANVTIDDVNQNLKALYAEDSDWNQILSVIGHSRTERERRREDLFAGFANPPEGAVRLMATCLRSGAIRPNPASLRT